LYDFQFQDARLTAWFLVTQTWPAMYRVLEVELAKVGLTPEKLNVLWLCTDHPPPLIPAEISRFLFRKSHSVAGLLNRMERDGLVKRVPKRKGHPFTEVQITAKGRELVAPGKDVALSLIGKLMSPLSEEELTQLQKLLRKLRQYALEEMRMELKPWPGVGWGPNPSLPR
jgi:DNA-binding MarR family transcriptional regulator